jgi:hypothetical protein
MKKKYGYMITILFILIGIELIVRQTWGKSFVYSTNPSIYQYDSVLGYVYKPKMEFCKSGKLFKINNQGFVGKDFSKLKKEGVFRIAFFGSCIVSGTFSYSDYSNCCTTIEELFNKNHWKVEICNFGVDGGHRSYETFNSIKYLVNEFNPDLIICEYILPLQSYHVVREDYRNYVVEYTRGDSISKLYYKSMIDNIYKFNFMFKIIDHVYTMKLLCFKYINYRRAKQEDFSMMSDNDYDNPKNEYLELMLELYLRKKIHFSEGVRYKIYNEQYNQYSMKKSIQLTTELIEELKLRNVDFYYFSLNSKIKIPTAYMKSLFIQINTFFDRSMFYDADHFNVKGNKKLGEEFFITLTKNHIVPQKYLCN